MARATKEIVRAHGTPITLPNKVTMLMAASQEILKNTMFSMNASGLAVEPTDGDGFPVVGVAAATFRSTTSAVTKCEGTCQVYGAIYAGTAPKPNDILYVVDNQTVSIDSDSGARGVAGVCSEVRDGLAWFPISPSLNLQAVLAYVDAAIAAIPE